MALDKEGNVAAAVSTGGIWLKWPGRIGDSPVPGAGFWAENGVGAFCATGVGEVILMTLLSYRARNELLKTDKESPLINYSTNYRAIWPRYCGDYWN